jgi:distribution and morphology protein 31
MSWITSGRLDAVLDIKFPYHPEESLDLRTIFDQIGRNVATITTSGILDGDEVLPPDGLKSNGPKGVIPGNSRLARPPLRSPKASTRTSSIADLEQEIKREVTVDIDLRFRDLKAAVPMFTADLSVANNAFIRPIVAFIK